MIEIRIQNAARDFRAARDDAGIPHVRAANWLDALYGLGYMHALDRGTQLLFARSVARGRAAEEIADRPQLAETDRLFRRVGLHLRLDEEFAELTPEWQEQITVYCDGVNAGLRDLGRTWPMWAVSYEFAPWDPAAVVLVGRLLSFGGLAVSQWENERLLLELIHAGVDELALKELFAPRLDAVDFEQLRDIHLSNRLSDEAMELLTDLPRLAGSNAWAVSGKWTATGHAMLAADPHLEVNRLPAIWYEAVLCWDQDRYVMGASLPGCPLFAIARTPDLAWGVTHMKGDLLDFFIEDCRRRNEGWQYRRGRRWYNFTVREEVIGHKGGEPEVMRVLESDVGALEGDPDVTGEGRYLTVLWTGNLEGSGTAIASWLEVLAQRNVRDAMEAVKYCHHPALCWVFADREGHIGLQGSGRFPRRHRRFTGLTPIPAWDSRNHWRGWLDRKQLPRLYDPPEGFIATANEEQVAAGGIPLVTQPAGDYRRRRIVALLAGREGLTVEDMQVMQYDVRSLHAEDMLEVFLPALPDGTCKDRLANWDRRFDPDSEEATLFFRLYLGVMMELLGHNKAIGWRRMLYLCSRAGYSLMVLTAADRLLKRKTSRWWKAHDKDELIRAAAQRVMERPLVPWSEVNNFHFTDRFFGGRQVGRLLGFDSRRYPMPGCHATLFYGHVLQSAKREATFAPSYHFVTDMGTDEAWTNLPGGPSENRFSRWYRSDVQRWLTGKYKQLAPCRDEPVLPASEDDEA